MNAIIKIEDVELEKVCYRDQPVLTLADIDKVHGRPEGTAKRNFNENRDKFISGSDYFDLPYEEWSVLTVRSSSDHEGDSSDQKDVGGRRGNKNFMTMHGYLMLVKSFKDDRAWRVQRLLVDSYFDLKVIQKAAKKDVEFVELQGKYIALLEKNVTILESLRKKPIKRLTDEERKAILDLHQQGVGVGEISRRLERSKAAISNAINFGNTSGRQVVSQQPEKAKQ